MDAIQLEVMTHWPVIDLHATLQAMLSRNSPVGGRLGRPSNAACDVCSPEQIHQGGPSMRRAGVTYGPCCSLGYLAIVAPSSFLCPCAANLNSAKSTTRCDLPQQMRAARSMALHVNYEIRWKNFRCFRDTAWITLRPLTILIGPNNSGKTSILAPILLLNQTMNSRDIITPLVTRGQLIDAGTFKDVVYGHDTTKELFFGLRFHVHEAREQIGPVGESPPGVLTVTLKAGDQPQDVVLKRYELFDVYQRPFLSRSRHRSGSYTLSGLQLELMAKKERDAVRSSRPVNFLFSPTSALHAYRMGEGSEEEDKEVDFTPEFSQYLRSVGYTHEELGRIFVTLSYIGPLRDRPRRYYEVAGEIPRSVGPRGENTANLLYRHFKESEGSAE